MVSFYFADYIKVHLPNHVLPNDKHVCCNPWSMWLWFCLCSAHVSAHESCHSFHPLFICSELPRLFFGFVNLYLRIFRFHISSVLLFMIMDYSSLLLSTCLVTQQWTMLPFLTVFLRSILSSEWKSSYWTFSIDINK